MSLQDDMSKTLYDHYTKAPDWLFEPERESLGTSFELVHELAVHISCLDLSAKSLPVTDFERATGIEALTESGDDLRSDAFLALDSSVGDLLQLVGNLECYRDEETRPPLFTAAKRCPLVPDDSELLAKGRVSPAWMDFFRQLRDAYTDWDDAACRLPTNVTDIVALCYRAYRLVIALHVGTTAVRQATLRCEHS